MYLTILFLVSTRVSVIASVRGLGLPALVCWAPYFRFFRGVLAVREGFSLESKPPPAFDFDLGDRVREIDQYSFCRSLRLRTRKAGS